MRKINVTLYHRTVDGSVEIHSRTIDADQFDWSCLHVGNEFRKGPDTVCGFAFRWCESREEEMARLIKDNPGIYLGEVD